MTVLHGPRPDEPPTPALGPVERVAVLSDVHANIPALRAVLSERDVATAELVVFCGDLTWGPEPEETVALVGELGSRAVFVRGNADRAVLELAAGTRERERPRDGWMPGRHSPEALDLLSRFHFTVVVDVVGLGPVRFCHGSPRSDTEAITPETPAVRFAELMTGVGESTLVSGHTHLQFDRRVGEWRSVNPGSVGLAFHDGDAGTAMWALLGPGVSLRRTPFDVADAVLRAWDAGDPSAEVMERMMTTPPTVAEIVAHAEERVFAD
ncbi:MAG TPA: metallophosphoesterase family protein [Phytomonospora sp.]